MTGDVVSLRIPRARPFHSVARLVVGGLAARLDFSYEHLEDLQLALASVLENEGYGVGDDLTVELRLREGGVEMTMGPLEGRRVRSDLASDQPDQIGLGRLLATVAEDVKVEERGGGDWLHLEKRVTRLGTG